MQANIQTPKMETVHTVHHPASILFVESNAEALSGLKIVFQNSPYRMSFTSSAEEGLVILRGTPIDVVVADIGTVMPDGTAFLKAVGELMPDTIRILLGGYEQKGPVLELISVGIAQYYLLKPWDELELTIVVGRAVELHQKLKTQNLLKVLNMFSSLPSPPRFQARMHELLNNADKSINDIVKGVEGNPALVAKLLQVANSVFCGVRQEVTSVREAIIFIGTEYVKTLVLALEVFQGFIRRVQPHAHQRIERLWERSIRRATIAKTLSIGMRGSADAHIAYAAALFQDVGYLVRLCTDPEVVDRMLTTREREQCTLHEAEVRYFSVLHDEVGAALLERWNFPFEIIRCVANHHRETGGDPFVKAIQVAELIDTAGKLEPHDPAVEPLAEEWRKRMDTFLPSQTSDSDITQKKGMEP